MNTLFVAIFRALPIVLLLGNVRPLLRKISRALNKTDTLSIAINENTRFNSLIDALDKLLIADNPDSGLCERIESINLMLRTIAETGEISF